MNRRHVHSDSSVHTSPEHRTEKLPAWIRDLPEKLKPTMLELYAMPEYYWPGPHRLKAPVLLVVFTALLLFSGGGAVEMLCPAFQPKISKGPDQGLPVPWAFRIVEGTVALAFVVLFGMWIVYVASELIKSRQACRSAEPASKETEP